MEKNFLFLCENIVFPPIFDTLKDLHICYSKSMIAMGKRTNFGFLQIYFGKFQSIKNTTVNLRINNLRR